MAKNREGEPTRRVHVHLFEKDVEDIHDIFGNNVGFSKAIREIVSNYMRIVRAKSSERAKPLPALEIGNDGS